MASQILIVGAGPVGLALGMEMTRLGIEVRIIDKKKKPSQFSKALGVMPRTLELLEKCGVADRMMEMGNPLKAMNIIEANKRIAHQKFSPHLDSRFPILILPQSNTEEIFIDKLKTAGVDVEWETRLMDLRQEKDTVHVEICRKEEEKESSVFSWLMACDGVGSTIRDILNLNFDIQKREEAFLLADLEIDWNLPYDEAHAFMSPDGDMGVFPFAGKPLCRIVGPVFDPKPPESEEISIEMIKDFFHRRCAFKATLREPEWRSTFFIQSAIIDKYRLNRIFFAGDSAHVHSPQGGQGMNSGIQDAFNLAWKLAMVHKGRATTILLDSYQSERHPVARKIILSSGSATGLTVMKNKWIRKLRNLFLGAVFGIAGNYIIRSMGNLNISYGRNQINREDIRWNHKITPFSNFPRAGDRAPDTEWVDESGKRIRLFDLFQSVKFVFLYFSGNSQFKTDEKFSEFSNHVDFYLITKHKKQKTHSLFTDFVDPEGKTFKKYKANHNVIYIVRPDGHIAWVSRPANLFKTVKWMEGMFQY